MALLLDHRYLYRSPSGWLMPFADKSARGYFIVRDCYGRSGKLVQQTRVTCKGKNHLFKSHLMSVISSIAKDADNLQYLQNKNFAKEMKDFILTNILDWV